MWASARGGSSPLIRIARRSRTIDDPDVDEYRTERQKEWAAWAAHGYRKLYQPRSVLRWGLVFTLALAAFLLTVILLAVHNDLP